MYIRVLFIGLRYRSDLLYQGCIFFLTAEAFSFKEVTLSAHSMRK